MPTLSMDFQGRYTIHASKLKVHYIYTATAYRGLIGYLHKKQNVRTFLISYEKLLIFIWLYYYILGLADTYKLKVKPGKTYLLRLINAALNDDLFFSIANHSMTVVEADALYVKPFETDILLITPGQTTNVLLKTKPIPSHSTYLMYGGEPLLHW